MSSILTNNGAMVALQTLKGINASMAKTQNEISTGKSVADAKDNAAIWAISKTMEADVAGFKQISSSLELGRSTVAVARKAAETTTKLLTDIKAKVIAGTKADISDDERTKLQTDIDGLKNQIKSVVSSAQFNGQNLINGAASNPVQVLASLDRSIEGVNPNYISVGTFDMRASNVSGYTGASKAPLAAADTSAAVTSVTNVASVALDEAGGANPTQALVTFVFSDAAGNDLTYAATDKAAARTDDTEAADGLISGDKITITVDDRDFSYVLKTGDTSADVATALDKMVKERFAHLGVAMNGADLEITNTDATLTHDVESTIERFAAVGASLGTLVLSEADGDNADPADAPLVVAKTDDTTDAAGLVAGDKVSVQVDGRVFSYDLKVGDNFNDIAKGLNGELAEDATLGNARIVVDDTTGALTLEHWDDVRNYDEINSKGGRGLMASLEAFDVMTLDGAKDFLGEIENLMTSAIDSAASFGSAENRITIQNDFIGQLSDALRSGIGSMVDADMEETSARLQALQVQQQLGVQSLSIANQAPQMLLSLFR